MVWLVAISKPAKESYAAEQLRNQGCETYVPFCLRDVKQKTGSHYTPLVSRYFLFLPNGLPIRTILSTRGLHSIVKHGDGSPATVSQSAYEQWVRDSSAVQDMRKKAAEYILRQTYMINSERYGEMPGELIEVLGGGKLKFQLNKDYGHAKITVSKADVSVIAA